MVEQIQVEVVVYWEDIVEMDDGALGLQVVAVDSHGNSLSILDTKVEEEDSEVANWASSIAAAIDAEEMVDKS